MRVAILGDSKIVSQWANATSSIKELEYVNIFKRIWNLYSKLPSIRPLVDGEDLFHHIFREHNTCADSLANKARQSGDVLFFSEIFKARPRLHTYAQVDGSSSDGVGGAGAIIFLSSNNHVLRADDPQAEVIACVGL